MKPSVPRDIGAVAGALGLEDHEIERHGAGRAKIRLDALSTAPAGKRGRYVLVTAMTPTGHGVGKTVTSIGLAMGFGRLGQSAAAALRQSSLGPTFGLKGGGAGGGAASVVPLEECLVGLGSDLFAVETANNLLAAVVEDGLHRHGDLDPDSVGWRRVLDVDDRSLRRIVVGLGGSANGPPRETGFDITAASEVMTVLALSRDRADLRLRLERIVPCWTRTGTPVTAGRLGAAGAMAAVLEGALQPNLMQASDGTPVLVHTGPFGNISTGNSSVVADRLALPRVDYLVTEAGFGSDLGAEKFFHLKCPASGEYPDVAVLVATIGCLRDHGRAGLGGSGPDVAAVQAGTANLARHIAILGAFGVPVVVAVNRHPDDAASEVAAVLDAAVAGGAVSAVEHRAFDRGGEGCVELAGAVAEAARHPAPGPWRLYPPDASMDEKVEAIATRVYGAADVVWDPRARRAADRLAEAGFGQLPICMAKTHLSLSHEPAWLGAPSGFALPVRDVRLAAGAGYLTVYAGDISTMPGLPSHPRLADIDVDDEGRITGLV